MIVQCALDEIADCLHRRLAEVLDPPIAEKVAGEIVSEIASNFGGAGTYIRKRPRSSYAERNAEIRREFNGCNHNDLARRYGVSKRQIYRLVKL